MTRRAAVWKSGWRDRWVVDLRDVTHVDPATHITHRCEGLGMETHSFPTHAEALAWAIRAVGLSPKDGEDQ